MGKCVVCSGDFLQRKEPASLHIQNERRKQLQTFCDVLDIQNFDLQDKKGWNPFCSGCETAISYLTHLASLKTDLDEEVIELQKKVCQKVKQLEETIRSMNGAVCDVKAKVFGTTGSKDFSVKTLENTRVKDKEFMDSRGSKDFEGVIRVDCSSKTPNQRQPQEGQETGSKLRKAIKNQSQEQEAGRVRTTALESPNNANFKYPSLNTLRELEIAAKAGVEIKPFRIPLTPCTFTPSTKESSVKKSTPTQNKNNFRTEIPSSDKEAKELANGDDSSIDLDHSPTLKSSTQQLPSSNADITVKKKRGRPRKFKNRLNAKMVALQRLGVEIKPFRIPLTPCTSAPNKKEISFKKSKPKQRKYKNFRTEGPLSDKEANLELVNGDDSIDAGRSPTPEPSTQQNPHSEARITVKKRKGPRKFKHRLNAKRLALQLRLLREKVPQLVLTKQVISPRLTLSNPSLVRLEPPLIKKSNTNSSFPTVKTIINWGSSNDNNSNRDMPLLEKEVDSDGGSLPVSTCITKTDESGYLQNRSISSISPKRPVGRPRGKYYKPLKKKVMKPTVSSSSNDDIYVSKTIDYDFREYRPDQPISSVLTTRPRGRPRKPKNTKILKTKVSKPEKIKIPGRGRGRPRKYRDGHERLIITNNTVFNGSNQVRTNGVIGDIYEKTDIKGGKEDGPEPTTSAYSYSLMQDERSFGGMKWEKRNIDCNPVPENNVKTEELIIRDCVGTESSDTGIMCVWNENAATVNQQACVDDEEFDGVENVVAMPTSENSRYLTSYIPSFNEIPETRGHSTFPSPHSLFSPPVGAVLYNVMNDGEDLDLEQIDPLSSIGNEIMYTDSNGHDYTSQPLPQSQHMEFENEMMPLISSVTSIYEIKDE